MSRKEMRTSCSLVRRSDESCAYFALQRRISSTLAGNENTLVWGRPLTLPEHQLPTGTTIELATAAPHIEACRARHSRVHSGDSCCTAQSTRESYLSRVSENNGLQGQRAHLIQQRTDGCDLSLRELRYGNQANSQRPLATEIDRQFGLSSRGWSLPGGLSNKTSPLTPLLSLILSTSGGIRRIPV